MKPLVKNAADPNQTKNAAEKELRGRERELHDVAFILSSPEGRRFYFRLLAHCKTFGSIWANSALIHYNSGMQDVGHFLMAELNDANPEAYLLMMKEQKQGEKNV